ncbi:MAG: hypothetical protein IJT97_10175 [Bacteroidaceae bacterium]|nr:hypothetical protein [Bacteroidaceae bacterium]
MANFNKMAMAATIASQSYITISSSFFGLCKKIVYEPTQSSVKPIMQEYTPGMGEQLQRLLSLPLNKWKSELKSKSKPECTAIGKYRLEACLSDDHQFCALQLLCYGDTYYEPVTELQVYQGEEAKIAALII